MQRHTNQISACQYLYLCVSYEPFLENKLAPFFPLNYQTEGGAQGHHFIKVTSQHESDMKQSQQVWALWNYISLPPQGLRYSSMRVLKEKTSSEERMAEVLNTQFIAAKEKVTSEDTHSLLFFS